MNDIDVRRRLPPELVGHTVGALSPLLPGSLELVGADLQVLLLAQGASGCVIATHTLSPPVDLDTIDVRVVAHHLLADVQDLVVTHLHAPWPTTARGRSTHLWTGQDGRVVRMGFRGGEEAIALPDFAIPDPPATVVRPAG